MNPENYRPCAARLSQGDLVRAPVGAFARIEDIPDPSLLGEDGPPIKLGNLRGAASIVPRLRVSKAPVVLQAWYLLAVVISPDCDIDKGPAQVLITPLMPLDAYSPANQDAIKAGSLVAALDIPPDPDLRLADNSRTSFPHSVLSLRQATPVAPGLIMAQRMVALSESQIERLHNAWVRFVALREISSTGTIAAMVGKRVLDVSTVESSRRRHTVLLTLDDQSLVVVYQEPRRAAPHLQQIQVTKGAFSPKVVRALAGSELILQFENEDSREWFVTCPELGVESYRLTAAGTSRLPLRCPETPGEAVVVNSQKRASTLTVRYVAPPGSPD